MNDSTPMPELDQLGAQLGAIEAEAAAAAPGSAAAAPPADPAQECELLVAFAFDTLAPWYPATCAAWTPDKRAALKNALVPLASKYGLTLSGLFDRWGPEVGLALVVVPMIGPTMQGLRTDRAAVENRPATPGAPGPNSSTVKPPPPAGVNVPQTPTFHVGDGMVIGAAQPA